VPTGRFNVQFSAGRGRREDITRAVHPALSVKNLICFFPAIALLAGCVGQPHVIPSEIEAAGPKDVAIAVVNHGWHTGLVVPATLLNEQFPALKDRFVTSPAFYEIGWGDKGFYQAEEITTGLALRAMFWSSGSVVHVVAIPLSAARSFRNSEIARACLSASQANDIAKFLASSFRINESGNLRSLNRGIYGDSQFYEGVGHYAMLNTCNVWTAKALRSAGFDISPAFKLTAGSVMSYLKDLPRGRQCEPQ
jgi:uncharacterized protein (TIGR02117 family)